MPAGQIQRVAGHEVLGERPDVFSALTQRGDRDRHDVEAVDEVFAE